MDRLPPLAAITPRAAARSLRLPPDLPALGHAAPDERSPADVQSVRFTPTWSDGSRGLVLPPVERERDLANQNEIKKAQNRKSAKRFREAQKARWKGMEGELANQKLIIARLKAELAERDGGDGRRVMAIGALVDGGAVSGVRVVEAEASLYAQVLQSVTSGLAGPAPYVAELGALERAVVVTSSGAVVSTRRSPATAAPCAAPATAENVLDGLSPGDAHSLSGALSRGSPVAVGYVRYSQRFNAVVKPIDGECNRVIIAEFIPFRSPMPTSSA